MTAWPAGLVVGAGPGTADWFELWMVSIEGEVGRRGRLALAMELLEGILW